MACENCDNQAEYIEVVESKTREYPRFHRCETRTTLVVCGTCGATIRSAFTDGPSKYDSRMKLDAKFPPLQKSYVVKSGHSLPSIDLSAFVKKHNGVLAYSIDGGIPVVVDNPADVRVLFHCPPGEHSFYFLIAKQNGLTNYPSDWGAHQYSPEISVTVI